jgi:hypothetical protein
MRESGIDFFWHAEMWKPVSDFCVSQPWHRWAVSAVFGLLAVAALTVRFRYPRIWWQPLAIVSVMWLVYGFLERSAVVQQANIRIDYLFLWPFIFDGTGLLVALSILNIIVAIVRDEDAETAKRSDRDPRSRRRYSFANGVWTSPLIEAFKRTTRRRRQGQER